MEIFQNLGTRLFGIQAAPDFYRPSIFRSSIDARELPEIQVSRIRENLRRHAFARALVWRFMVLSIVAIACGSLVRAGEATAQASVEKIREWWHSGDREKINQARDRLDAAVADLRRARTGE